MTLKAFIIIALISAFIAWLIRQIPCEKCGSVEEYMNQYGTFCVCGNKTGK